MATITLSTRGTSLRPAFFFACQFSNIAIPSLHTHDLDRRLVRLFAPLAWEVFEILQVLFGVRIKMRVNKLSIVSFQP